MYFVLIVNLLNFLPFKLISIAYDIFFYINNKKKNILLLKKNKKIVKKVFYNHTSSNKKILVINLLFNYKEINFVTFLVFLLKIFELAGYKIIIFNSHKFYSILKFSNFILEKNILSYANTKVIKNLELKFKKIKNINDIKKFKWKNVQCGKYALSTTLRFLKCGDINFKNQIHLKVLKNNLKKSILTADATNQILKKYNINGGIFIDKGYIGEGEILEIFAKKNLELFNFFSYFKNNQLIIKRLDNITYNSHPAEISNILWNKLKKKKILNRKINSLKREIYKMYEDNIWYPSAGTNIGKKISSEKEIRKYLGFNDTKKIAVIFSHIFWDGSFFFGNDLFDNYEKWFVQTLMHAKKNRKINWVIKFHPANIVKNARENIKNKIEDNLISKHLGNLPKNIKILREDVFFSSLKLYNILDYCITVRGTPGIECVFFGKETITAGSGRYSHKGFTCDSKNKKEYFSKLLKIPNLKKKNNKDLSAKYFYHQYKVKPFNYNFINFGYNQDTKASAYFKNNIKNFEQFKKNKDVIKLKKWIISKKEDFMSYD